MKTDVCLPDTSQIAQALLAYLAKHPYARDTEDRILETWLSGQKDRYNPSLVHDVIKDLVLAGTLLEETVSGPEAVYRLNTAKRD
jgi:hypothetical protein